MKEFNLRINPKGKYSYSKETGIIYFPSTACTAAFCVAR